MEILEDLRIWVRRWLGIASLQKSTRDRLAQLEEKVAISQADLDRLNAATSRIAARVNSLLDQIGALGTGNDDAVRQEQQIADIQAASDQLRPVLDQLEALGADAGNVVPEPTPEQVPVEPGPDVAPVENGGVEVPTDGATVGQPEPGPGAPVGDTGSAPDRPEQVAPGEPTPGSPDGDVTFNPDGTVPGETVVNEDGVVVPADGDQTGSGVAGNGGAETVPGPSGDAAGPTER